MRDKKLQRSTEEQKKKTQNQPNDQPTNSQKNSSKTPNTFDILFCFPG